MIQLVFVKEVQFDGVTYYVFNTNDGERKVVEAAGYRSFHLKAGIVVTGRIRSKGCAGEEITELLHPFYCQGETYSFQVKRKGSLTLNNELVHFVVVLDPHDDEYKVKVFGNQQFKVGDKVFCRLDNQVKGRLNFSVVNNEVE